MTDREKLIYNTYIRVSRRNQNKPYKERKKFDGFEKEENYPFVKKLGIFFNKYQHIKVEEFFAAPYLVYEDKKYYDLRFYTTYQAVKVYTIYENKIQNQSPDDELILTRTKEGVKFIQEFCKTHDIPLSGYFDHKTDNLNSFWLHLKNRNVSLYCLFLTDKVQEIYRSSDKELLRFMIPGVMENIGIYRNQLYSSEKMKELINKLKPFFM